MPKIVMLIIFIIDCVEFKRIHYTTALRDNVTCFSLLL